MTTTRPAICLVGGPDVDARRELIRYLTDDFSVCAVGTDAALAAVFRDDGVSYRSYTMSRRVSPLRDLRAVWQLVRIFRAERPLIVHTFDTKPGVWARLAARIARVPIVIGTLPGLGSLYSDPDWRGRLARLAYQPLQTIACRLADLTVFQNEDDASEFERRRVVRPERAVVIPGSGVRTDLFTPADAADPPSDRTELGLPPTGLVVLMVSRLLRSKGVLDFATAARATRRSRPDIAFVLVGPADGESIDGLSADEIDGLRDSVTWLGRREDVNALLKLADIFVLPSFYREGVPRVLLEAAATGLPLVAADVPGSREVVEDGVNGLLVPPESPAAIAAAVVRLADAPELRRRFGESSRLRAVERFDVSVIAGCTRSLYREQLAKLG